MRLRLSELRGLSATGQEDDHKYEQKKANKRGRGNSNYFERPGAQRGHKVCYARFGSVDDDLI